MLYLIAHKVRGERAFDVAERMEVGDEHWWIIPTSGHRAYPYWHYKLEDLFAYQNVGEPPIELPDHYQATERFTQGNPHVSGWTSTRYWRTSSYERPNARRDL